MMNYYSILPIGDNCEIAGHLHRNGYTDSSLFRYASSSLNCICDCFENNFENIFSKEKITPINNKMVKCDIYNIAWHTNFKIVENEKSLKISCKDSDYKKEWEKIDHLKKKTIRLLKNSDHVLFIYKSNLRKYGNLNRFYNIISQKYPNLKFKVLVIKEKNDPFDCQNSLIDIRDVNYLAPYEQAMSGGDNENWDKIIKEYLFINPFKNIKINGNEPADYLRDIAVIFEQEGDIDTAKKLMLNAHQCRPTGSLIKNKLNEYMLK
ncbi:DUF1796 family putative cysteine peptidase [Vibrio parahaemolyticus]|uniref:DUF1796 family putative cysteine peptidase n=1 Tax=Vibrio parahaemolyticus TaxID=670 RepID=UPI001F28E73E|nr:DUF1796 family putative cysteine peptidase [Vibrio parahaemolyticus]UJX32153.1 hypothetical protein JHS79_18465 [Vibrio parahaemolyticus]